MFLDINTYIGHWPFRNLKYNTLAGLDELAGRYGITHMVVANIGGFFYKDANTANLELLDELKNYSGKTEFLPLAVVNPTYPAWEKDARDMIAAGFAGFELAPIYHGYSLAPELLPDAYGPTQLAAPVMELAKELDVPVRICASLENFRGRSNLDKYDLIGGDAYYALLSKYPDVHVFCTSFAPYAGGAAFNAMLKTRPNTYFDTTQIETFHTAAAKLTMNVLSKDQLCFGSLSPFNYMESNLLKMELDPAFDKEAMQTNAARAFKALR